MEIFGEIGVLADDGEKVQCHVCGKWFKRIGGHHLKLHGLDVFGYREKYGLNRRCPLSSTASSDVSRNNCTPYFITYAGKPCENFLARPRVKEKSRAQGCKNNGLAKQGLVHSDQARKKMSEAVLKAYQNPNTRKKIMEAQLAPERREKLSKAASRRFENPEYKAEAIARLQANSHTTEANAKRSVALKGKPKSDETKENMRNSWKNRKHD